MKIKAANALVTFKETVMVLITNDVVRLSKMTSSGTLQQVVWTKGLNWMVGWGYNVYTTNKSSMEADYAQRNKKTFQSAIFIARSLSMP